jgi:predicted deacylase
MISALMHGNEICGAAALAALLGGGFAPVRGQLILAFANVAAFSRFDPARPYASRFIDEDMNRVWSASTLNGARRSTELDRARALRPFAEQADFLLDLHSTSLPAPPMLLSGRRAKGRRLAEKMGYPAHVVADAGHKAGRRLRDFAAFDNPASDDTAMLVECGQHFDEASADVALCAVFAFLRATGLIDAVPAGFPALPADAPAQKIVEVTHAVTIRSERFAFLGEFHCFQVLPKAGTPIARDGTRDVLTPYDDCVLVMPARQPVRGQTAVRLGRYLTDGAA